MRPERTATAGISCASWVPISDLVFPNIISFENLGDDRGVRSRNVLCGKRLTRSWKLMASVSAMLHSLFSDSERERRCCTAHRTREVHICDPDNTFQTNAFSCRFSFLKQHTCRSQEKRHHSSRTLVFARPPIPAPFTCCPDDTKVGLGESLCDVFEVTAPLRCTLCTSLPSHGDDVSQLRPPVRHCTALSQIRIFASCLVCLCISQQQLPRRRIIGFDASRCELQCIHPKIS